MKKGLYFLIVLCIFTTNANATKWRVNNTPGIDADFTTFKEAHDGAGTGDTLYFEGSPNVYGVEDSVSKQLVIIGPGYFLNANDSTQANIVPAKLTEIKFNPGSEGSILTGMCLNEGILIYTNNISIKRNLFNNGDERSGINVNWGVPDGQVSNCIISQNFSVGPDANIFLSSSSNIIISNNIISGKIYSDANSSATITNNVVNNLAWYPGPHAIQAANSVITNNILTHKGFGIESTSSTVSNNLLAIDGVDDANGNDYAVDMSTVFEYVDYGGVDYHYKLKQGSPAIGAGKDGVDCGAFGGSQPYVLSGIPAGPHIFDANVSTSGSTDSGLPVTLKIKTQN